MEMSLGKKIAQLRRERGLKQDELSQKLGVSPQAVSKWENDISCPDISLLPQIAALLGTSVDELLTGKPAPVATVLPEEQRRSLKDMMLRIVVESSEGDNVRINIPMALAEVAIETGMVMPQISGSDTLKSIDLEKIIEMVRHGAIGNLVEVESSEGDIVRIFVE